MLRRSAAFTSLLALSLAFGPPLRAETLKKPALDALVAANQARLPPDFDTFLASAAKAQPMLVPAAAAYRAKAPLAGDDLVNVARLLGLYNRLHNQAAVIDAIGQDGGAAHRARREGAAARKPAILAFGQLVEGMAQRFRPAVIATSTTASSRSRCRARATRTSAS